MGPPTDQLDCSVYYTIDYLIGKRHNYRENVATMGVDDVASHPLSLVYLYNMQLNSFIITCQLPPMSNVQCTCSHHSTISVDNLPIQRDTTCLTHVNKDIQKDLNLAFSLVDINTTGTCTTDLYQIIDTLIAADRNADMIIYM